LTAEGHSCSLLRCPDDTLIRISEQARVAETRLRDAGARVGLVEYSGWHGWTEDPFGHIRRGIEWLDAENN
jgi:hypothetical protein